MGQATVLRLLRADALTTANQRGSSPPHMVGKDRISMGVEAVDADHKRMVSITNEVCPPDEGTPHPLNAG